MHPKLPLSIVKELEKFKKFTFHEDGHRYSYLDADGTPKDIDVSVTKLVHCKCNPFEEFKMSQIVADKRGVSRETILKEWHYARDFSCLKGNEVHRRMEDLWNEVPVKHEYNPAAFIKKLGRDDMAPIWPKLSKMADDLYERFRLRLIPAGLEFIIGSTECSVAGAIDFLGYSEKTNSLIILDYKTNKEITSIPYRDQHMRGSLSHLPDANFYTYSLQLALYRAIIERETTLTVDPRKYILWIHESSDSAQMFGTADLNAEAKLLLEEQKAFHNRT